VVVGSVAWILHHVLYIVLVHLLWAGDPQEEFEVTRDPTVTHFCLARQLLLLSVSTPWCEKVFRDLCDF
jgi:hypothetical protein